MSDELPEAAPEHGLGSNYKQWGMGDRLLMSPEHPGGWKLEELLAQVVSEMYVKCGKISKDDRPVAKLVSSNNYAIIGLINQALSCQMASTKALDEFAANQGPTGTPRIGVGSDGFFAVTEPEPVEIEESSSESS